MKKTVGTRRINGHRYYAFLGYYSKPAAKNEARRLNKQGYGARVYKIGNRWVVYATHIPILTQGR